MITVYLASDHAGFELKNKLISQLSSTLDSLQFKIHDCGPNNTDSVDYPDYANKLCLLLENKPTDFGLLICGSGQGMSLRANKFPYIRAALVYNNEIVQLSREHNNANVMCLGSRFCTAEQALEWAQIFLKTKFAEGRHATRVNKISLPLK